MNTVATEEKISRKGIFFVLVLGSVITSIVSTVMSTALPVIMVDFSITASRAQMVTSIYSLVSGIMILATAFVVKRFPTKRLFFVGMGLFAIGVLLCAIAPSFAVMLFGRVVQGVGYGIIISMTQMVILIIIPSAKRGFAMGVYGLAVTFAPVVAPMIAGVIIDHWGWRLIFWIILLFCVVDFLCGAKFMKNVLENSSPSFDILSMVLAAVGFTCIVLMAGNMGNYSFVSLQVGLLLVIGLVVLVLFAIRQMKIESPLLNLRVFKTRDFTVSVIIVMIFYALMNGMSTIIPILVQTVQGQSATVFGIVIAPCALITGLMSPVAGKLYDKIGMKPLAMLGTVLVLVSEIGVLFVTEEMSSYVLILPLVVLGFGMSFVMMNLSAFAMEKLEDIQKTDGTALMSCLRTIGGALGAAGFVSLMSVGVQGSNYTMANVKNSYMGMVVLAAVCVVMAFGFIKGRKKTS
ncbi:DHA2 family efflux MFS transporter permease subunit [Eubacterium oxidoreducens]|uniref:Drug resistance transporter, EmrB/QacA subfamily n=1 Tax=Eubacterium oxidoreducens TaxID=1732 RepID=A0A1G6BQT0_EUBOX|nr:DHA2 family efflux MFS transporter permease subunit [Eubacterium oxidoreducens]SDB22958.1 drug resistance transporter, EmrB/QacA subfamily [Eubacterium oxidoreducens]